MPLTVQKQLGLFLKRRCAPDAWEAEAPPAQGLVLPKPSDSQSKALPLMGTLSHQGGRKINTSGLGVLRCSPQGRETSPDHPSASLAHFHLALSALRALGSPDHPSFVSKEGGDYLGLFVYSLSWYQEPEHQWGAAWGGGGGGRPGPGPHPQCLSFIKQGAPATT